MFVARSKITTLSMESSHVNDIHTAFFPLEVVIARIKHLSVCVELY